MTIIRMSKNIYKVTDNDGNWAVIEVSADFDKNIEIILNGDLSKDDTIFIPGTIPTESTDDFAIIGNVRKYSFVKNSNVKATVVNSSLVTARIRDFNIKYNQTLLQAKNHVEMAFLP